MQSNHQVIMLTFQFKSTYFLQQDYCYADTLLLKRKKTKTYPSSTVTQIDYGIRCFLGFFYYQAIDKHKNIPIEVIVITFEYKSLVDNKSEIIYKHSRDLEIKSNRIWFIYNTFTCFKLKRLKTNNFKKLFFKSYSS